MSRLFITLQFDRAALSLRRTVNRFGRSKCEVMLYFSWDRVNFLPSSYCVLDLVQEEC